MPELGLAEHNPKIGPGPLRRHPRAERGDSLLTDQVAEEGRLRQELDAEKRRPRLQRNALQLLAAMKLAG
ncbi:MAG: hypothetical protein P4L84_35295 [Isosphaeraceae bacterium]|nr:hypothetical protein [Isosphaeraceae bacterium]